MEKKIENEKTKRLNAFSCKQVFGLEFFSKFTLLLFMVFKGGVPTAPTQNEVAHKILI